MGITWDFTAPILERLALCQQASRNPIFMELIVVAAWCIWTQHSEIIFDDKTPSLWRWLREELSLTFLR
jgi:uncharacterized membrane protein